MQLVRSERNAREVLMFFLEGVIEEIIQSSFMFSFTSTQMYKHSCLLLITLSFINFCFI